MYKPPVGGIGAGALGAGSLSAAISWGNVGWLLMAAFVLIMAGVTVFSWLPQLTGCLVRVSA